MGNILRTFLKNFGFALGGILRYLPEEFKKLLIVVFAVFSHLPLPFGNIFFIITNTATFRMIRTDCFLTRRFAEGFILRLNIRQKSQRQLYLLKYYEPLLSSFIKKNLKSGDWFVDVGAHVGYYSALAARNIVSTGHIIAIEPDIENFDSLEQNIKRNGFEKAISLHNQALSDTEGSGVLYRNPLNEGGHSLREFKHYSDSDKKFSSELIKERYPKFVFQNEVSISTLDILFEQYAEPPLSIIKIDVEGNELAVLKGAVRVLALPRLAVLCELSQNLSEIISFMEEKGFTVYQTQGSSWHQLSSKITKGNFLFLKGSYTIPTV